MLNVAMKIANGVLGKNYVYCLEESQFYVYMDGFWKRTNNIEIMKMAMNYFDGHEIEKDKYAINIVKYPITKRKQLFDNLTTLVYKNLGDFNKKEFLNFDKGEFDPATGELHHHSMNNYSTLRMPYSFDFDIITEEDNPKCDLWLKTLNEIFENNQDKIDILQEFFGYCLTKDTKQRKALLLIGESNCGKSTILWTIRNMLGDDNCSDVSANFIMNPQYTGNMMNKLANFDTDVSQDAKGYEESFKKVAGGEPVSCSPKYISTFSYKPYAKQCYGSNGFPRVTDHSEAFFNRLIIIPCDRIFQEEEQNKDLPELLKKELSGIFHWSVIGLQRLKARGRFEIKNFMKEAKQDLRDESNPIDVFLRETIQVDKDTRDPIEKGDLYNKYSLWCKNGGNAPMSKIKFGKAVFQKYNKVTEKHSQDFATGRLIWRNLKYKEINITPQENVMWQE